MKERRYAEETLKAALQATFLYLFYFILFYISILKTVIKLSYFLSTSYIK